MPHNETDELAKSLGYASANEQLADELYCKLKANPELYEKAKTLALLSAYHESALVRVGAELQLKKIFEQIDPPPAKPQYKWVQGARVRCS